MDRTLVCPTDDALLARLRGRRVVFRVDDASAVEHLDATAHRHALQLVCVWLRTSTKVAALPIRKEWASVPLALYARETGPFRELVTRVEWLRSLNVRLFLPGDAAETYRDLRILASLGVACGVQLCGDVLWEELADLMGYALLSPVAHAPITPFAEIASWYRPQERTPFGRVFFDDSEHYLHVDERGRVALSADELARGEVFADDVTALEDVRGHPAVRARAARWTLPFLKSQGCAWCPGFRVCLARFENDADVAHGARGCRAFFEELLDVVEQHQAMARRKQVRSLWQP